MYVWVYHSRNAETKDSWVPDLNSNHVPIYDGQLFFQSESNNQRYYTFNRTTDAFATVDTGNPPTNLKFNYIPVYMGAQGFAQEQITRLDHFNCDTWDKCTPSFGAYYSQRDSIKCYDASGAYVTSINSAYHDVVFEPSHGYTKASTVSEITGSGVGIRVSGYRNKSTGVITKFADVLFASEAYRVHPLNYNINTA